MSRSVATVSRDRLTVRAEHQTTAWGEIGSIGRIWTADQEATERSFHRRNLAWPPRASVDQNGDHRRAITGLHQAREVPRREDAGHLGANLLSRQIGATDGMDAGQHLPFLDRFPEIHHG